MDADFLQFSKTKSNISIRSDISKTDFDIIKGKNKKSEIGKGSYSSVVLVKDKISNLVFAMKIV